MNDVSVRRGDVFHIQFERDIGDHYGVVISADVINQHSNECTFALITSKRADDVSHHEFRLPDGILPKTSKVKCHVITTFPKRLIQPAGYRGSLTGTDLQGLDTALSIALGIW